MKYSLEKDKFIRKPSFPLALSNFKDEETNHMAYVLFNELINKYDIGKTIALVRYKLKQLGYDLQTNDIKPVKPLPTISTQNIRKKPEDPMLFTWDELKYS